MTLYERFFASSASQLYLKNPPRLPKTLGGAETVDGPDAGSTSSVSILIRDVGSAGICQFLCVPKTEILDSMEGHSLFKPDAQRTLQRHRCRRVDRFPPSNRLRG